MIDAPALFVNHFFDLASVCNVVRELLALSKLCPASRSSRLTTTFILGDLIFLSSKVYMTIHNSLCDHRFGPFHVIDKVGLTLYKLEHHRGWDILLCAIVFYFLRHPLIKLN